MLNVDSPCAEHVTPPAPDLSRAQLGVVQAAATHTPLVTALATCPDFLGRMPIPLRSLFKAGIDRVVAQHQAATGRTLRANALTGGEWFAPFASVMQSRRAEDLPALLAVTCSAEMLNTPLQEHYRCGPLLPQHAYHPLCQQAGLIDPLGIFQLLALIPFVLLVDEQKLGGRPLPRRWADLLDPCYRQQIVFGGWRASPHEPYQECNRFLLLNLWQAFGPSGVQAFAANVRGLLHHARIARDFARPGSDECGAIAILPWAQAQLCRQRQHTRIIWPEEGAYTMHIAVMVQPGARLRVKPLLDYLLGPELACLLNRNFYPSALQADLFANETPPWAQLPEAARFNWLGWSHVRAQDMNAQSEAAQQHFFNCWSAQVIQSIQSSPTRGREGVCS